MFQLGRNALCPCGSGKKFKQCCHNIDIRKAAQLALSLRWSSAKVAALATEEIFTRLRAFGIAVDADQFSQQAPHFYSACELANHWWTIYPVTAHGFDEDFPWMAAVALWPRLLPDVMNSERLDDMMQEGYIALEHHDQQGACTQWLKVWEYLKTRFTPGMCSIESAEDVFSGQQYLFNWCQDLEMELGNAGLDAQEFTVARLRYCTEFCVLFPESSPSIIHCMRRASAESLIRLGRLDEGDQAFQQLIADFPTDAFSYIGWGDMYHWDHGERPVDFAKAERIYRLALAHDVDYRDVVLERLAILEAARCATELATATN